MQSHESSKELAQIVRVLYSLKSLARHTDLHTGTGLAEHLQVPLPYLLYRAQVRYEEDLRGLQGIQTSLSPTVVNSPNANAGPSQGLTISTSPGSQPLGEQFPTSATPDRPFFSRRDTLKFGGGVLGSSNATRPLPIRTRLNSLGHRSINSPQKVTSSSLLTLQGPRRRHLPLRLLSPTSSRASPSTHGSSADESSDDEESRKLEEQERRAEEQAALERKLKDLTLRLTKDQLGLVSSPPKQRLSDKGKGKQADRGRMRPLSASSASGSSILRHHLDMNRRNSLSQTPSHHSLSSTSSPHGSIPSIPSPPPEARSRSQPQSPMARQFSPAGKSTSPPAVVYNNAWGMGTRNNNIVGKPSTGRHVRSDVGSEFGSATSSFSDFSGTYRNEMYSDHCLIYKHSLDASLSGLDTSASALDSRGGSRV